MRILLMVGMMLLGTCAAWAYEIPENPDQRPSLGFNYERYDLKGDYTLNSLKFSDAGLWKQNNLKGDFRIPVASFLTLNIGGGYTLGEASWFILSKDERYALNGYNINAGFRLYFPK